MSNLDNLLKWTREACARYELEPIAVYRPRGDHDWPITANNETELTEALDQGGHFLPLPKEPAALANIIEVSLVDFLMAEANKNAGISMKKGTERGYPDIDLSGQKFGDKYFAIDIKAARRKASNTTGKVNQRKTQSRITLYTGNTYFKFPQLHWPGTFRPFDDYDAHIDIIAIYTLDESSKSRIKDFELIVQESWRIGSKQRSSTTREYIGAVDDIERLRKGEGEFETKEAFYKFWRKYPFKFGPTAAKQLEKLLAAKDE